MKVYIAGKITGNENYKAEFAEAEKKLRTLGHIPLNPVVRCKDCKWFADNNDGDWLGCWLFQTIQIIPEDAPKPDDFCSYGEPKMNEGDSDAVD